MELARGQITDRPWGQTLGAVGFRGVACQVVLTGEDGKEYVIVVDREAIVAASSPLVADSIIRIATTAQLITPAHVPVLTRRLAALAPHEDEVDILAEICHLDPELAMRVRRRAIAQRAARTFGIDRGTFVLHDEVTIAVHPDAAIDIRAIVLAGARTYLSEPRLVADLHKIGTHFSLRATATDDLDQFGFAAAEKPLLESLRFGATIDELAAKHPDLDARTIQATVYALIACYAADAATIAMPQPMISRTLTPQSLASSAASNSRNFAVPIRGSEPMIPTAPASPTAPMAADGMHRRPLAEGTHPPRTRLADPRLSASGSSLPKVDPLLALAKADPLLAAHAPEIMPDDGESGSRKVDPAAAAAEAFTRGMSLLRDDMQIDRAIEELATATNMDPSNPDYLGMLAWAHFCKATDKQTLALRTRKALAHAIHKSQKPELAHFYMGRVERILGRDQEALEHFEVVLDTFPKHAEARAEVRVLRQKIASGSGEKPGLSSLFGRKK